MAGPIAGSAGFESSNGPTKTSDEAGTTLTYLTKSIAIGGPSATVKALRTINGHKTTAIEGRSNDCLTKSIVIEGPACRGRSLSIDRPIKKYRHRRSERHLPDKKHRHRMSQQQLPDGKPFAIAAPSYAYPTKSIDIEAFERRS